MSVADKLETLLVIKDSIKDAIIEKGVDVSDDDAFTTYADKILQIEGGGGAGSITKGWSLVSGYWGYEAKEGPIDGMQYLVTTPYNNGSSVIQYRFKGSVTFYIRTQSNGEDYLTIGDVDQITDRQNYKYLLQNTFKKVSFKVEDEDEHFVQFCYSKDSSGSAAPDNAIIYVCSKEYEELPEDYVPVVDASLYYITEEPTTTNTYNYYLNGYEDYQDGEYINKHSSIKYYSDTINVVSIDLTKNNIKYVENLQFPPKTKEVVKLPTHYAGSTRNMFNKCELLEELDLTSFYTKNIEDMTNMFSWCRKLHNLNVSNWDTSNLKYASNMFEMLTSIGRLDLSSFDTHNLKTASNMFYGSLFDELILGEGWKLYNATDLTQMFCSVSVKNFTLTDQNFVNEVDLSSMFNAFHNCDYCNLANWSNVNNGAGMFKWAMIKHLDVSNWSFNGYTLNGMFYDAQIDYIDARNWVFNSSVTLYEAFKSPDIKIVNVEGWKNTHYINNLDRAFMQIDWESADLSHIATTASCRSMFDLNVLLKYVDVSNIQATDLTYMFYNCWNLEEAKINAHNPSSMTDTFYNCKKLKTVYIYGDLSNTNFTNTFRYCESLNTIYWYGIPPLSSTPFEIFQFLPKSGTLYYNSNSEYNFSNLIYAATYNGWTVVTI